MEKKNPIHIKESHKGKFTEHCGGKVTIERFKAGDKIGGKVGFGLKK